jgi:hypothetical protein
MYQNRDPSLTTFKKDLDQTVAYRDLPRADEKQRVREVQREVQRDVRLDSSAIKNQDIRKDLQRREINQSTLIKSTDPQRTESSYPPLYEPRKAPEDRPVDASSFVTGGTVDVRA